MRSSNGDVKLRVAILGSYSPLTGAMRGGAESACSYLVQALARYPDLDLHIVSMAHHRAREAAHSGGGVTQHFVPVPGRGEFWTGYRTLRRALRKVLSDIDPHVVHAQDLTMGAVAHAIAPDRTVLTVHGIVREEAKHFRTRRERLRALARAYWIERTCLNVIKHVIVISPYVRRYYRTFSERSAYDIPNAIDDSFFEVDDPGITSRILYAGRIIPRKRVEDLLRMLAVVRRTHPDAQLRIAGDSSNPAYRQHLYELTDNLDLSSNVTFLGQLDEYAIMDEFRCCRLVVLASGQETAPMVVAQAMAAGKPVVATQVGGVPEMIADGRTGFTVPIGAIETFADRVGALLTDDELYRDIAQNARAFADEQFRAESVAARTRDVYYRVASGTGQIENIPYVESLERV